MNPKLHKERIRTSSQRPDIIIAFQNFFRQSARVESPGSPGTEVRAPLPKRTA